MADGTYTTPETWSASEKPVGSAKLNRNVRDNQDVTMAVLEGDGSTSTKRHRHKEGTLAARPAAGNAGRYYGTSDTQNVYRDDGTNWRHISGGAYDDFFRADSTTITPSRSGHAWTESIGDLAIASNLLKANSIVSGSAVGLLDTKGVLDRSYQIFGIHTAHSTPASADCGFIVKAASSSNYIYTRLTGSVFEIRSVIASVDTQLASVATTPTANLIYEWRIVVAGAMVDVALISLFGTVVRIGARHSDIVHANLATATNIGVRVGNTVEAYSALALQT